MIMGNLRTTNEHINFVINGNEDKLYSTFDLLFTLGVLFLVSLVFITSTDCTVLRLFLLLIEFIGLVFFGVWLLEVCNENRIYSIEDFNNFCEEYDLDPNDYPEILVLLEEIK